MSLNPQVIGKTMPHGYAGSYARQPDMIVNTRPAGEAVLFGQALVYNANGQVVLPAAGAKAADFVGVTASEVKSALNYLTQSAGSYAADEPVSVFQRGAINVKCQNGTAALGGAVYLRLVLNEALPQAVVGGFEAAADSTESNSILLPNCEWAGPADANGIAEMRIKTINRA